MPIIIPTTQIGIGGGRDFRPSIGVGQVSGHRIANAERARLDDSRATRWRPPTPGPVDDVRAKIVTDLAGLLILLSLAAGFLIAAG